MKFTELDALVVANQMGDAENLYLAESERLKLECTAIEQFSWAEHAAKLNIPDGISDVFDAYRSGRGVEPNSAKAFAWLRHGASLKGGKGLYFDLAVAYRDGDGTEVDIPKFWKYMTLAAEAEGGSEAMYHLAQAHERPALGDLSQRRSLRWTTKMADAGAAGAMTKLARYNEQSGTDAGLQRALTWAESAVKAAKSDVAILTAFKSNPSTTKPPENWVNDDLPNALAALADIFVKLNQPQEARKADKDAAEAAQAAVKRYDEDDQIPDLRFPQLMLREVAHHAGGGDPRAIA